MVCKREHVNICFPPLIIEFATPLSAFTSEANSSKHRIRPSKIPIVILQMLTSPRSNKNRTRWNFQSYILITLGNLFISRLFGEIFYLRNWVCLTFLDSFIISLKPSSQSSKTVSNDWERKYMHKVIWM